MSDLEIQNAMAAALKPLTDQITTLSAEVKALKEAKPIEPVITLSADGKETRLTLAEVGTKLVALEANVSKQALATETADKAKVIALFAADGKVPLGEDMKPMTPEVLGALPLGVLKILHASTPVTVPLTARGKTPKEGGNVSELKGLAKVQAAFAADRAAR